MSTNILILCTHNSACSVLAEGMLNHWAAGLGTDVRAFSAGSRPSGRINRHALQALASAGVDTTGLRSKNWDEFIRPGAPQIRAVITLCASAAAEQSRYWLGSSVRAHWVYPDPSAVPETEQSAAFELTRQAISYRMLQLLQLPLERLDDFELQAALQAVSKS